MSIAGVVMEVVANLIFILIGLVVFIAFIAVLSGISKETTSDEIIERMFDDEGRR